MKPSRLPLSTISHNGLIASPLRTTPTNTKTCELREIKDDIGNSVRLMNNEEELRLANNELTMSLDEEASLSTINQEMEQLQLMPSDCQASSSSSPPSPPGGSIRWRNYIPIRKRIQMQRKEKALMEQHNNHNSSDENLDTMIGFARRRSQIVFFDLETTVASGNGDKPKLLEFGAVVLEAQGLRELYSYSSLVRQPGVYHMGAKFQITRNRISELPSFDDIADNIFDILHGRIWAGHNIKKFDMVCIRDAFSMANRQAPQPVGVIDTLPLLRECFGPRAGNLKMASLAQYCGLGKQKHRSLDDVRLNVDVLKHCATILFLESRFPEILELPKQHSTRSCVKVIEEGDSTIQSSSSSTSKSRWDHVIQNQSFRMNKEMKHTSLKRPTLPSSEPSGRQPRVTQYIRGKSRPLALASLMD